ncbi:MAG: multicopper oxidase domain-containing protein, partial [Acidobacteriota bacterium]
NVMLRIGRQKEFNYLYKLPKNHAPGTHWYHGHVHGSTALQVQGGMAGALIVDPLDAQSSLNPPGYRVQEHIIVIRAESQDELRPKAGAAADLQTAAEAELIDLKTPRELEELVNRLTDHELDQLVQSIHSLRVPNPLLTVNGQVQPVASVANDEIQRLRLINAGSRKSDFRDLWIRDHDMYLAAFDGINLTRLTRSKGQFTRYNRDNPLQLAPGNRADVFFIPKPGVTHSLMAAGRIQVESFKPQPRTPSAVGPGEPRQRARALVQELISFSSPPRAGRVSGDSPLASTPFLEALDAHLQGLQESLPAYRTGYLRPFTEEPSTTRSLTFNVTDRNMPKKRSFSINMRSFNPPPTQEIHGHHDMPGSSDYLGLKAGDGGQGPDGQSPWPPRAGTEEEWTVKNESGVRHPLHIHVSPFWITDIHENYCLDPKGQARPCDLSPKDIEYCRCNDNETKEFGSVRKYSPHDPRLDRWQDTVTLPHKGSVTFRHRFSPGLTGLYVLHCHILQHEDRGMMMNILTVPHQHRSPGDFFKDQNRENERLNRAIASGT